MCAALVPRREWYEFLYLSGVGRHYGAPPPEEAPSRSERGKEGRKEGGRGERGNQTSTGAVTAVPKAEPYLLGVGRELRAQDGDRSTS